MHICFLKKKILWPQRDQLGALFQNVERHLGHTNTTMGAKDKILAKAAVRSPDPVAQLLLLLLLLRWFSTAQLRLAPWRSPALHQLRTRVLFFKPIAGVVVCSTATRYHGRRCWCPETRRRRRSPPRSPLRRRPARRLRPPPHGISSIRMKRCGAGSCAVGPTATHCLAVLCSDLVQRRGLTAAHSASARRAGGLY